MHVTAGPDAWGAVQRAMSGECVAAAVAPGDAAGLAMIAPHVAVSEPDAGAIAVTSGSTGTPKGVVLSRAALRAASDLLHERLGGPGAWTCALPVHYVAGLMTLVRSWCAGREPVFAASDLSDLAPAGTAYLSVVATQLHRALTAPEVVSRLRDYAAVLVGGSALPAGLLERARTAGIRVVTSYGMSETCGGCVYDGMPLRGVDVTVGERDRLEIAGPMVFSGYRLRPDLTAEVLVGGRFLTSDRGSVTDGAVRVWGRVDDVVISGGVNVDLAAMQRTLDAATHGQVVVLGVPDTEWGTRVVAATTGDHSLADIHDLLDVAPAARPKQVRRFAALPRTATGKLDRRALVDEWSTGGDGSAVD